MTEAPYKTISQVSKELNIPAHTLRFWESRFSYLAPKKKSTNQRFYNNNDMLLIKQIIYHLKDRGFTIKGVNSLILSHGVDNFRNGIIDKNQNKSKNTTDSLSDSSNDVAGLGVEVRRASDENMDAKYIYVEREKFIKIIERLKRLEGKLKN